MKVACRIVKLFGFCGNCQNPDNPCASACTVNEEIVKADKRDGVTLKDREMKK